MDKKRMNYYLIQTNNIICKSNEFLTRINSMTG